MSRTDINAVYENSWAPANKGAADNDFWGVKDMNTCCGKVDVKIPSDLAAGDYLLRAEVIALHTAGSSGGAQFYISCCKSMLVSVEVFMSLSRADQLGVTGGGSLAPATVKFPGAYKASDPGIMVNIHSAVSSYVAPGPAVISSGTTVKPGSAVCPKAAKMIRGMNDMFSP